jgi:hypothetical protein
VRILAPGCGQLEIAIFSRDKPCRVILFASFRSCRHDQEWLASPCFSGSNPSSSVFCVLKNWQDTQSLLYGQVWQRIWLGSSYRAYLPLLGFFRSLGIDQVFPSGPGAVSSGSNSSPSYPLSTSLPHFNLSQIPGSAPLAQETARHCTVRELSGKNKNRGHGRSSARRRTFLG